MCVPNSIKSPRDDEQPGPEIGIYDLGGKKRSGIKLTSICPKDHIVLTRVVPTLIKIEEQVLRLKVDVTSVCPRQQFMADTSKTSRRHSLHCGVTKVRLFDPRAVLREKRMTQGGPLVRCNGAELSDRFKLQL